MNKPDKKVRSFRLALVDALSHERLWSIRFTRTAFIIAILSAVVLITVGLFSLIAYTPIRTFIPGYPDAHSRRQAVQNALRIDSLETRILQWELYTENLRRVVAGETPIQMDSLILSMNAPGSLKETNARFLALRDSLLRADVAAEEQFEVSAAPRLGLPIEALSFFTPVKGVISKPFDLTFHPWLDVTAPAGTMVMSVLDGSVMFITWDAESGSIYKNILKPLQKTGDSVKAGAPLGVLASSSSLTKGDHLHFELWYSGAPVDPVQYIKF